MDTHNLYRWISIYPLWAIWGWMLSHFIQLSPTPLDKSEPFHFFFFSWFNIDSILCGILHQVLHVSLFHRVSKICKYIYIFQWEKELLRENNKDFIKTMTFRLDGCTNDWLIGCTIYWLKVRLIDWLIDWLINWLVFVWLIDLFFLWIDGRLDRLINWLIDKQIHSCFHLLIRWLYDWWLDWFFDRIVHWKTRLVGWLVDWLVGWFIDQ